MTEDPSQLSGTNQSQSGYPSAPMSAIGDSVASLLRRGAVTPPPRPGTLGAVDHYELVGTVGTGGMGIVFLASNTETGAEAAIKFVRPDHAGNAKVVQRFILEAQHLQKLRHPNLVPILGVQESKGSAYFVMPYYPQGSLAQLLKSGTPLLKERIIDIALAVAEALSFAHSKGIIHRDIKPGNILLDGDGSVRLGDFGLARSLFNDATLNVEGDQCEGTAPYMSPQVAAGEAEDTRCDIYAVGALLYEMLTGVPPYRGKSSKEIRRQVLARPPKRIREIVPKADIDLAQIAEWAMAREHRDRYACMRDLLADLRRMASGGAPLGPHQRWNPSRLWASIPPAVRASLLGVLALVALWATWPRMKLIRLPFNSAGNYSWSTAQPAELDGRPGKELVLREADGTRVLSFLADGSLARQWPTGKPPPGNISALYVFPSGSGFRDQLYVCWWTDQLYTLARLTDSLDETGVRFTAPGVAPHKKVRSATGNLLPLGQIQFRPGDSEKLIAHLDLNNRANSNDYSRTRAVICFNSVTGEKEWDYMAAPRLLRMMSQDLNGDGIPEIILGGNGTGNGYVTADGRGDTNTCVLALSSKGKELWYTNVAGLYDFALPIPAKAKGLGMSNIVVLVTANPHRHKGNQPSGSRLLRLDSNGVADRCYEPGSCLLSCLACDIDGDGWDEILCSDCRGCVHVLNGNLVPLRTVPVIVPPAYRKNSLDHLHLELVKHGRFFKGQSSQLLAFSYTRRQMTDLNSGDVTENTDPSWTEDESICLLSEDLKPLISKPLPGLSAPAIRVADMDGDGLDEILVVRDRIEIYKAR